MKEELERGGAILRGRPAVWLLALLFGGMLILFAAAMFSGARAL